MDGWMVEDGRTTAEAAAAAGAVGATANSIVLPGKSARFLFTSHGVQWTDDASASSSNLASTHPSNLLFGFFFLFWFRIAVIFNFFPVFSSRWPKQG